MFPRELYLFPGEVSHSREKTREINTSVAGQRRPPIVHGTARVERFRCLKRTEGGAVIKSKIEIDSLIKVFLGFGGLRTDLSRIRTQTIVERLQASGLGTDQDKRQEKVSEDTICFHTI